MIRGKETAPGLATGDRTQTTTANHRSDYTTSNNTPKVLSDYSPLSLACRKLGTTPRKVALLAGCSFLEQEQAIEGSAPIPTRILDFLARYGLDARRIENVQLKRLEYLRSEGGQAR